MGALGLLALMGCQTTPAPIFPAVSPPIIWPRPPDQPRIRYIGELRGEASLGVQPTGWAAFQAVLVGPPPMVEFLRPSAVAVRGERVFVADTGLGVVHLLDLETHGYQILRGDPTDPLRVPLDLAIAGGNQLFVADPQRGALDTFDLGGTWRGTRRLAAVPKPIAVAWDDRRRELWVVDRDAHACVATADMQTVTRHVGQRGGGPGQFNFPTAIAWHPLAGLVIADAMNFRVQVFGDAEAPRAVFGQKGDAAGDFARPRAVAIDSHGHIYVLDNQFENVQVFTPDGRLLMAFGEGGAGAGQFALPSDIFVDARDRIWVADSSNRRVQVFQYLAEPGPEDAAAVEPGPQEAS